MFKSNLVESVKFQKKCLNFMTFEKCKNVPWRLVGKFPVSNSCSRWLRGTIKMDILDLKWVFILKKVYDNILQG